jgi:YVTN family beta-propeller protein
MRRIGWAFAMLALLVTAPVAEAKKAAQAPVIAVADTVPVGHHPEGVDIDSALGLAVTANRNAQSASIVDLAGGRVIAEIPVGLHPIGVAINALTHRAVVTNAASSTISIIDIPNRRVTRTVRVGLHPVAVAIHPEQNRAVVANQNDDTVSVVDLATGAIVATLRVGRHPSGVAVNPEAGPNGTAAVVSAIDDTVTLVDLAPAPRVDDVFAIDPSSGRSHGGGSSQHNCHDDDDNLEPAGIAWDVATNTLAIANAGDWSVAVLALDESNNVVRRAIVPVGKRPQAVDAANGYALVTSDEDDAFVLDLATRAVLGRVDVGKDPRGVAIDADACRAVVTNRVDDTLSLLQVPCGVLRLDWIEPDSATAGSGPRTLTLHGTGFLPGSVVNFGAYATPLVPTSITPTTIVVTLPRSVLAVPGTFAVSVTTPAPQTSNTLPFAVSACDVPVLTSLVPPVRTADFQPFVLTVMGRHFLPGAVIWFDGVPLATTVDGPGQAHGTVPGTLMNYGRAVPVVIVNPGNVSSNTLVFTILNPAPILSEVTPNNVVRGSADTEVVLLSHLTGQGAFVLDSRVYFCQSATSVLTSSDCVQIPATPFAPNPPAQINARIPGALLTRAGVFAVRVYNPAPGGGESFNQPFTVTTAAPLPGYGVTVFPLAAGHPERVTLVASGLAAAVLPETGQLQFVSIAPGPTRGLRGLLTVTGADAAGLLGDADANVARGTVVVAVPFGDRVEIIDVNAADIAASIRTPVALPAGGFPFGVAVNRTTNQAAVVNLAGGSLSLVDLTTRRLVRTIDLPGAVTPTFVAVNPSTNIAVVVDQGDLEGRGWVSIVDLTRNRVNGTVLVGHGPTFVAVNPTTSRAVIANSIDDTIAVVDIASRTLVATIPVGQEPVGVAVDPATNRAMVANTQDNRIVLVDLNTFAVTGVLPLGADGAIAPSDLVWDPVLRVAVTSSASVGDETNNLILIDLP